MIVMDDDFGNRGGFPMPQSNSGGNNLVPRQNAQLASKELGEIIVRSFEAVTDAFEGRSDVPVDAKQIEDSVKNGINKSDLVKKGIDVNDGDKNKGKKSSKNESKSDEALAKLYDAKRLEIYKKRQEREEEREKRAQEQRDRDIEDKIDKVFSKANEWANNPLRAVNDLLEKGIKGILKGGIKLLNTPIADVGKKLKGVMSKAGKKVEDVAVGTVSAFSALGDEFKSRKEKKEKESEGEVLPSESSQRTDLVPMSEPPKLNGGELVKRASPSMLELPSPEMSDGDFSIFNEGESKGQPDDDDVITLSDDDIQVSDAKDNKDNGDNSGKVKEGVVQGTTPDGISYEVRDDDGNDAVPEPLDDALDGILKNASEMNDDLDELINSQAQMLVNDEETEALSEKEIETEKDGQKNEEENSKEEIETEKDGQEKDEENSKKNNVTVGKVMLILGGIALTVALLYALIPVAVSKMIEWFQSIGDNIQKFFLTFPETIGGMFASLGDSIKMSMEDFAREFFEGGDEAGQFYSEEAAEDAGYTGDLAGLGKAVMTHFKNNPEEFRKYMLSDGDNPFFVSYEGASYKLVSTDKYKEKTLSALVKQGEVAEEAVKAGRQALIDYKKGTKLTNELVKLGKKGTLSEAQYLEKYRNWGLEQLGVDDAKAKQALINNNVRSFAPNSAFQNRMHEGIATQESIGTFFKNIMINLTTGGTTIPSPSTSSAGSGGT